MVCPARVRLFLGLSLALAAGCGSSDGGAVTAETRAERVHNIALTELGDVLRLRAEDSGKPPEKAADLTRYDKLYTVACPRVKSGELVVLYGVAIDAAAGDKILAYEKQVPESGGNVLMQDGKTIKKMTADEFKAAPKAGGA